jgi:GNAT superfamily N-acetyltransferase
MNIRDANKVDAQRCGRILYDAFKNLAEKHNFPPDFPSPEVATGLASMLIGDPGFYGVVAEEAGTIVGSNFMDERSTIFGIGPISVAPEVQNHAVGRRLMCAVLDRAAAQKAVGIRLVQAGYHNRSLCLYTKLGFVTREPLSLLQGPNLNAKFAGYDVRPAEERDVEGCNKLCREVHGFDRDRELRDAIRALGNCGRTFGRDHGICDGDWLPCPRRRPDKSRFEGSDWRGNRISWPGIPVTNAESRRFRMVPELRAEAGLSDDVDEHWPLQRACRCLLAFDSVLKTYWSSLL